MKVGVLSSFFYPVWPFPTPLSLLETTAVQKQRLFRIATQSADSLNRPSAHL
jgi:hypothetical protein